MADFTILPPRGPDGTIPAVLGKPSVDGPIVYPELQPGESENVVPFTRETGIDPSKIPSLDQLLVRKKPALRMLQGGTSDAMPESGPVANAEEVAAGAAPAGAMVIANTEQTQAAQAAATVPMQTQQAPQQSQPQQAKQGKLAWWHIALVAGGALLVGYSLAKKRSDEPLVADMDDEEGPDEENEG